MLCVRPMRLHTASSLGQLIRFSEVRGRPGCRMGAALACAVPCGIRRGPSFDRTGSLTTSKRRWMQHPGRALSLRTLRWRFREGVRSRSIFREMWITGCGNYDFRPNKSLQPTAFRRRLSSTVGRPLSGSLTVGFGSKADSDCQIESRLLHIN